MTVVVDASVVVAGLVSADATGQWAESVLDTRLALAPGPRCGFCLPPLPPA